MRRAAQLALLFTVAITVLPGPASCVDDQIDRATLRGLANFRVVIEWLEPDVASYGLSGAQLQTDVELRLRDAGLVLKETSPAWLYVRVSTIKVGQFEVFAYSLDIQLRQPVTTGNGTVTTATTWSSGAIGCIAADRLSEKVRKSVSDHVDQFLNAYLSVNPK